MKKDNIINIGFVLITVIVTLLIAEFAFRRMLFSNSRSFVKFRNPADFANSEWDENYWKLAQIWKTIPDPARPDKLLGWQFEFWRKNYIHPDFEKIKNKRPVLLYGDSFANCIDSTNCFEDYLNNDSIFNKDFVFLNYGVGGYGVDQIYSLMKSTYSHYDNPIVIFSFLTSDLDRSILSYRGAQKPIYFVDEQGKLSLDSSRFNPDWKQYLKDNQPDITSYLWKKFLFSKMNFLPDYLKELFTGEDEAKKRIRKINTAILNETFKELDNNHIDYFIYIFSMSDEIKKSMDTWRPEFLEYYFQKNKKDVLWSKDVLEKLRIPKESIDDFFIKGDGHPNSNYNFLISQHLKNKIQSIGTKTPVGYKKQTYYFTDLIDSIAKITYGNPVQMNYLKLKAANEKNFSLNEMVRKDALYQIWLNEEKE